MKHCVFRILICILLGAVTTFGLAVAAYLYDMPQTMYTGKINTRTKAWEPDNLSLEDAKIYDHIGTEPPAWIVSRAALFLSEVDDSKYDTNFRHVTLFTGNWCDWTLIRCFLLKHNAEYHPLNEQLPAIQLVVVTYRVGWPFRAMGVRLNEHKTNVSIEWRIKLITLLMGNPEQRKKIDRKDFQPTQILIPGFIMNTLIFGCAWYVLIFGYSTTRRTLRKRKGHCILCGYNLRGDFESGCPECGWNR